jgi:hypothetical protein
LIGTGTADDGGTTGTTSGARAAEGRGSGATGADELDPDESFEPDPVESDALPCEALSSAGLSSGGLASDDFPAEPLSSDDVEPEDFPSEDFGSGESEESDEPDRYSVATDGAGVLASAVAGSRQTPVTTPAISAMERSALGSRRLTRVIDTVASLSRWSGVPGGGR